MDFESALFLLSWCMLLFTIFTMNHFIFFCTGILFALYGFLAHEGMFYAQLCTQ